MKYAFCSACQDKHNLYYLIRADGIKVLFYLCPKLKGRDQVFTVFTTLIEGLTIPVYKSGTPEYDKLKSDCPAISGFSDSEKKIIKQWQTARLVPSNMTKEQFLLIKKWCLVTGCFGG